MQKNHSGKELADDPKGREKAADDAGKLVDKTGFNYLIITFDKKGATTNMSCNGGELLFAYAKIKELIKEHIADTIGEVGLDSLFHE